MDQPKHTRRPDADSVHLEDAEAVSVWTRSLGISIEDLEQAVAAVGHSTGAVYDYINRNRRTR